MVSQTSYRDAATVGIKPPTFQLPDAAHVGIVMLGVSNLERSVAFYRDVIGLALLSRHGKVAELGVAQETLLRLEELPGVEPIERRTRLGLYHTAFLLPNRAALASFIKHLSQLGVYFGAGDHIYSEALYLVDPDGLSVEVYADRPRSAWQVREQELLSATAQVDFANVLKEEIGAWDGAPVGTRIGHVHFYIGDLERARRFYHEALGFTIMTWSYPGALFVSAGGYHHHVGLNVWAGDSPKAGPTDARLLSWELVVPSPEDVQAVRSNLNRLGWTTQIGESGTVVASDPWGITVRVLSRGN
ncbi:MAG: VOC family protein [Edaphobacter sp.]|uniref:VOC family protein n=1 Tax=Edaphobacter sp. TaxID=1934404 RepID=UPI0023831879|nr:VOC family protein [Edaphobacter sp.]MDE1178293.1 VOC family protein [Edaphobacter sp.]